MADKGKKPGGDSVVLHGPFQTKHVWEFMVVAIFLAAILSFLVAHLLGIFQNDRFADSWLFRTARAISEWFATALPYLKILSFFLCILLLYFIFSTMRKYIKMKEEDAKKYAPPDNFFKTAAVGASATEGAGTFVNNTGNKRWERILSHVESKNPNDWKIAIIEADSILDEMIKSMGYHGENMGERMKGIEVSDFNTINNAWDAHKVRNQIAHEGANFQLNERETRRVIALYESVFKEFKYI